MPNSDEVVMCVCLSVSALLGVDPTVMLGMCSITKLHSKPIFKILFYNGLAKLASLAMNLQFSFLIDVTGMDHHIQLDICISKRKLLRPVSCWDKGGFF